MRRLRFFSCFFVLWLFFCNVAIAAPIPVVDDLKWEGTIASWSPVEDAYRYEMALYRNGTKMDYGFSTASNSLDLASYMNLKGNYTFRVRVRDRVSDELGKYSNSSPTHKKEKDDVTNTNSSSKRTTKKTVANQDKNIGPGVLDPNWKQGSGGWWYQNQDQSYPKGQWQKIGENWYYFNADGYMQTGWIQLGDKKYYCDNTGVRVTGWVTLEDGLYYFDENGIHASGR